MVYCWYAAEVCNHVIALMYTKSFNGAFLSFAFHAKPVLAISAIRYSFGCQDSHVMDLGGSNSAGKTPPSPSFSPILDISSP